MTTYNYKGTTLQLNDIGADFDVCASLFGGFPIRLMSVQFNTANDNNKLVIKESGASGPEMFNIDALGGNEKIEYYHGVYKKPYIDYSECTLVATDTVIFNIM